MRVAKCAALLLAVALSVACKSWDDTGPTKSWVGQNVGDLIASWGPADTTTSDGRGGAVLVYYERPQNHSCCYKMMYVDKDGIIYSWRQADGWGAIHTPAKP